MKVAVLCEYSGIVRDAFIQKGHDAVSCDFLPTEKPGPHIQGNLFDHDWSGYDFIGSHYPCTYMANSGVRWLYNKDGSKNIDRWIELEISVNNFNELKTIIKEGGRGYLENPIPHKYARDGFYSVVSGEWVEGIGKYTQIIQPWQFGHGETKATCLWLIGLEELQPTNIVSGREHRVHLMPPGIDRWKHRSRTFPGIANAMADQWGNII